MKLNLMVDWTHLPNSSVLFTVLSFIKSYIGHEYMYFCIGNDSKCYHCVQHRSFQMITGLKVIHFFRIDIITKSCQIELKNNLPNVCLIYKRNLLVRVISFHSEKKIVNAA